MPEPVQTNSALSPAPRAPTLPRAPALPAWLSLPLVRVPAPLSDPLILLVLNRAFAPVIAKGELDLLDGRRLTLEARDIGRSITISLREGRLCATPGPGDATVSAACYDFLQLAAGRLDPDTLFFQRRLSLAGDTELALGVKNLLGSLDPAGLLPGPLYPLLQRSASAAQRWAEQIK